MLIWKLLISHKEAIRNIRFPYIYALFAMSRPLQLVAVTSVYLMGTAMAVAWDTLLDTTALLWGYIALIPVSASIHYANEYADHETDALTSRTPYSGGSGALPRTGLPPRLALNAASIALTIGLTIAVTGRWAGYLSPAALGVLLFGAFFGWMYSLPPLALAWNGWGELDNAMLGGIVLPVYGFSVQTGYVNGAVIAACFPFGALVFINLLATTWPDRWADAQVGKYTLATRWQRSRLRLTYLIGSIAAFGALLTLSGGILPSLVAWSSFLALPLVIWGAVSYTRIRTPFPTVAAMVLMLLIYLLTWCIIALSDD